MEFNQTRPYGVEIEGVGVDRQALATALNAAGISAAVEGYGHQGVSYWKVTTDASVQGRGGFELVSPKLYGQAGLDDIRKAVKAIKEVGGRINSSCGLHVHHSAQGMSTRQLKMVSHFYSSLFQAFDGIFSLSRHHSQWCALADPQEVNRLTASNLRMISRYQAVNLTAYLRHGTIEFRQHQGTLNALKITSWVVFTQQFMLGALRSKKAVSWRKQDFRTGLFNFWRLYDKDATMDSACQTMMKYVAKRANWRVGKIIAACQKREEAQAAQATVEMQTAIRDIASNVSDPLIDARDADGRIRCQCNSCIEGRARLAQVQASASASLEAN